MPSRTSADLRACAAATSNGRKTPCATRRASQLRTRSPRASSTSSPSTSTALLDALDGRTVTVGGTTFTLETDNLAIDVMEPGWRTELLATIANPNVAYVLMLLGIYGLFFELANPGAVVPGVIGTICLLVAMFALQMLPVNYAGLALVLLGITFMVAEVFVPSFGALGIGGVVAFAIGSLIPVRYGVRRLPRVAVPHRGAHRAHGGFLPHCGPLTRHGTQGPDRQRARATHRQHRRGAGRFRNERPGPRAWRDLEREQCDTRSAWRPDPRHRRRRPHAHDHGRQGERTMTLYPTLLYMLLGILIAAPLFIKILREYERAVVFTFGRFTGVKGPGFIIIIPLVQQIERVSLRTFVMDVPTQDVISRDNVSVKVNAVIYFRVIDPERAIIQVDDYDLATSQLAQTTLRSVLGQHELDDMLSQRDKLNRDIQGILDDQTDAWGIKVANVEIKHVDLDESMVRAIARQAEAERERRAKVIHAEGELQASESLLRAAEVLNRNPVSIQLRYLQTLADMSNERSSVIAFPVPMGPVRRDREAERVAVLPPDGVMQAPAERAVRQNAAPQNAGDDRELAAVDIAGVPRHEVQQEHAVARGEP